MMTGRQKGYKKNRSEEEEAPMRIPASPMRRVFAAAPPIVKYKKAPQAPKRFKSSYVINCSVLFELVRTVRFVETNIFHHPCLFCFFLVFSFRFCFVVLTVRWLSVSFAPFCSFVLTVRFLFCLSSIGSYIFFSTHKHKEIRSELEQQAGDHEQRQVRSCCSVRNKKERLTVSFIYLSLTS